MLILIHVVIALSSLIYTGYLYFRPSKAGLSVSYSLIGATLTSGTYLIVSTHANLTSTCITGIIYLSIALVALLLARRKLQSY